MAWLDWDKRPGIGLDTNGLPDIDSIEIPEGEFISGTKGASETYPPVELEENIIQLAAYKISRYPITNLQFQAFVNDGGYDEDKWWEGLYKNNETRTQRWFEGNRPVENVNWLDAVAFCRWLSAKTRRNFRLPTGYEWEKAARGGDGRKYPWGNEYKTGYANIDESWEGNNTGAFSLGETSAVGIYPQSASPYGLLDVAGNVAEWCQDVRNRFNNNENLYGIEGCIFMYRGGMWSEHAGWARTNFFMWIQYSTSRMSSIGFRVVEDI
ncbi:formylglycine-generating enzyme family protein [Thiothrix nivea]|uniref:Sulphatase-modifying factor protein n=1 Tax=Thiothrix nivea (strain ATCC 35100 / DSM 5205 / JP2) TaxID=870187 RepID=A0A656HLR5_THINJ|nr:SUMF1/EgtB/PvdO family nonheme iron enzyme [Thiothrix nivea]EIJ36239.1 Sulphatase-modifying factor protein [Thiothrix nivea DSM 5205]